MKQILFAAVCILLCSCSSMPEKIVNDGVKVKKLAGDLKFTEGPVWITNTSFIKGIDKKAVKKDGGCLIFSDIPANTLYLWSGDKLTTFRNPSNFANGNILDQKGRLVTCEHGSRSVTITDLKGNKTTLVDKINGKKFNSPNDLAINKDGNVWFTDPHYGLKGRAKEVDGNYVYMFNPKTKKVVVAAKGFKMPNGICFSPDHKKLYVADAHKDEALIKVFDIGKDNKLGKAKVLIKLQEGRPDGIRCDTFGNIWVTGGSAVKVLALRAF